MSDAFNGDPAPGRISNLGVLRGMIRRDREMAISDMLLALREAGALRLAHGTYPAGSGNERSEVREAMRRAAIQGVLRLIESAGDDVILFRDPTDDDYRHHIDVAVVRRIPETARGLK